MKWLGESKIRAGCNVEFQPLFSIFYFSQLVKGISANIEG